MLTHVSGVDSADASKAVGGGEGGGNRYTESFCVADAFPYARGLLMKKELSRATARDRGEYRRNRRLMLFTL